MSGTRLNSDFERMQTVWHAAKRLAQLPSLETLISRVALFSQAEPQRASLVERLLARDARLMGLVTAAVDTIVPSEEPFFRKTGNLGDAKTSQIVLTVCYHELIRSLAPISGIDANAFFKQGVGVAAASEIFAERSCRFVPHEAFIAGLLHHLGILAMGVAQHSTYARLLTQVKQGGHDLSASEEQSYGYTHSMAAEVVGEAWGLSAPVIAGASSHEIDPTGQKTIGLCVSLATRFCHPRGYDAGLGDVYDELPASGFRCVGVGDHNVASIENIIFRHVETFDLVSATMLLNAA